MCAKMCMSCSFVKHYVCWSLVTWINFSIRKNSVNCLLSDCKSLCFKNITWHASCSLSVIIFSQIYRVLNLFTGKGHNHFLNIYWLARSTNLPVHVSMVSLRIYILCLFCVCLCAASLPSVWCECRVFGLNSRLIKKPITSDCRTWQYDLFISNGFLSFSLFHSCLLTLTHSYIDC